MARLLFLRGGTVAAGVGLDWNYEGSYTLRAIQYPNHGIQTTASS